MRKKIDQIPPSIKSKYLFQKDSEKIFEKKEPKLGWHAIELEEVFLRLRTSWNGLSKEEVEIRKKEFGPNALPSKPPPTLLEVFIRQFQSPLIYVLLAAAIIALALGDVLDAGFIFGVILINAIIGMAQERKAEKGAETLQKMMKTSAKVRRDGKEEVIPAEYLVPGDIVFLESGVRVPADLRLISTTGLSIDESLLTGESVPVSKKVGILEEETVVSDRGNMAFASTTVSIGRGVGVVVSIGSKTEIGGIAEAVSQAEDTKPPLLIRLERFSKHVSYLVLAGAALLGVIALMRGIDLVEVFFLAVALAVSAIPEGLPVAVTVALAIRVTRMSKRNVLTRRLAAVESLGSCTCIASDKTGTLTVNKQTIRRIWLPETELKVTGEGYSGKGEIELQSSPEGTGISVRRLVRAGVLCNEATLEKVSDEWVYSGDAVDVAVLGLAYKAGLAPRKVRSSVEIVREVPFESERMYAATYYREDGRPRIAVKGAIEAILPHCKRMATLDGYQSIERERILDEAKRLAAEAYRVIAVAGASVSEHDSEDLPDLDLYGLLCLIDPPRPEVRDAVDRCRCAGIKVVMITGDHPSTGLAIAKELGIAESQSDIITGSELESIGSPDVPEFLERVKESTVFARVTPLQKLEIVDALIRLGHFVAVTGDGVNDAPAMRKANIGVAMGSGTDVAKDVSSIIITDDNFASIVAGVEEGRHAYDNIRKVTYLLVSTGAAEIVLFLLAIGIGFTDESGRLILPLVAVQLLWLNVVTNGIQDVMLAMEGGDPNVMDQRPRSPEEGIFNRLMVQQVFVSSITIGLIAFSVFYLLRTTFNYDPFAATNLTFLLMVLLENVHVFNCRSEKESAFKVPFSRNPLLIIGVVAAQGIHLLAMHIPLMQEILRIQPVSIVEWASMLGLSITVLVVMEMFKIVKGRREPSPICKA